MVVNKDDVLQAIKKLADDNGYDLSNNGRPYPPREHGETLYLAVQPKEGDERLLLSLVVTISSSRFTVTFAGANTPQYCKNLSQLLNGIKDWLLNRKV